MFNENGLLTAGIHASTLNDFEDNFIKGFSTSQSRSIIYKSVLDWLHLVIKNVVLPEEVWLDGSFVTNKINPNDLDVVLFFDKSKITKELYESFKDLQNKCKDYYCDAYFCFVNNSYANGEDINNRNYWRGQFGFDRQDQPKGIIKIDGSELQRKLSGRCD